MSKLEPTEAKLHDQSDAVNRTLKCRIPQRLPTIRPRLPQHKPKSAFNTKLAAVPFQQPRFAAKPGSRPRSGEPSRPKSANNKMKEDVAPQKPAFAVTRPSRLDRDKSVPASVRKPSVIPKRIMTEIGSTKSSRPVILVPVSSKFPTKTVYTNRIVCLPDQDTIDKHEVLELQESELIEEQRNDLNDIDSITSRNEKVTKLKIAWQEKIVQFEEMKNELSNKQKAIMSVYASLGVTHQKMAALGHMTNLPSRDELQIMNVTNMSPEQLLQLCANANPRLNCQQNNDSSSATPIAIDKLYSLPSKLVETCEHTLSKNKEIIDILETSLSSPEKIKSHLKKFQEFGAENEMLSCCFKKVKDDFIVELDDIIGYIRKSVVETVALNLRNEQLICEVSELNSQKNDLCKRIQEAEHRKPSANRNKVEILVNHLYTYVVMWSPLLGVQLPFLQLVHLCPQELEKQLKEEKCKYTLVKERISRATCQAKNQAAQVAQLEATLEQSQSHCWVLERNIHQLQEQNKKLHNDFGKEFKKFTESIRENTANLEEIAEAREKLQAEKEDLEKRLKELSSHYNESIKNMKNEMNMKIEKVIEIEMKYDNEKEERLKLVDKVESLCAQLLESELRYKDICKQLKEKELQLSEATELRRQLDITKHQLDIANTEIEKYRDRFAEQSEAIKEIERNFKESANLEENLKCDLSNKEEYIVELEKKVFLLEQQRQDSESKISSYENQLSSLKDHLAQFQEDFGEFENLGEIHEMVNQQRAKLLEATRQNGELAEALQKKDVELEQHAETVAEQEHSLQQRDNLIKMLSQKEEEHANIIKLLRNNLEMRTQADADHNQQLSEKNTEIDSLINNLDTRKQQIQELEKIILTLENQTRKASAQIRKDQEKIQCLESKLAEFENFHMENKRNETPTENLDSIIKILEEELIGPMEPKSKHKDQIYFSKKYAGDQRLKNYAHMYETDRQDIKHDIVIFDEKVPTKIVLDNSPKKTYDNFKCDLGRQKGITNIQKWATTPVPDQNNYNVPPMVNENNSAKRRDNSLSRNLHYLSPTYQLGEEKKSKFFKFAAHRL